MTGARRRIVRRSCPEKAHFKGFRRVGEEDDPSSPDAGAGALCPKPAWRPNTRPAKAIGQPKPCRSDDRGYDRPLG